MLLKKRSIITTKETPKKSSPATPNTRGNQVLDTKNKGVVIEDVSHRTHIGDSMRGLFYITQGRYKKCGDSFMNTFSGDVSYIGGYDPSNTSTERWYTLRDYETHHCIACGSDFEKVVGSVYTAIKRYKGSAKSYFKHISEVTSDDYYEVRYLGKKPMTREQRAKKAEGRCPRVSLADRCLHDCIYQEYGQHFSELIEREEERAYDDLERLGNKHTLSNKAKSRLMRVH